MLVSSLLISVGRALVFQAKNAEFKVSLLALEMLQIGGVIKIPWELELQNRLHAHNLDLGDAVLLKENLKERGLYIQTLLMLNELPSPRVLFQLNDHEKAAFPLPELWRVVADAPFGLRALLIRKMLKISSCREDARVIATFSNGFLSGIPLYTICEQLWRNPRPFTGGDSPWGPFAQLLRTFGISEQELIAGLPRFRLDYILAPVSSSSENNSTPEQEPESEEDEEVIVIRYAKRKHSEDMQDDDTLRAVTKKPRQGHHRDLKRRRPAEQQ